MQGRAKAPGFGRARSWLMFGAVIVTASATLSCTVAAVAGGVAAVAVGAAIITSGCYDPVKVELLDGPTGLPLCDAKLVAVEVEDDGQDGGTTEFSSCFYADVPVGKWRLQATRPGYLMTRAPLVVSKPTGCQPAPQRVTLFIWPDPSSAAGGVPATAAPALPATAPLAAPPPTYPGGDAPAPAPSSAPSVDTGAAPPSAPPASAVPVGGSAGSNAVPAGPPGAGGGGTGAR